MREAIRSLGPIDPDEQADMLAEFRLSSSSAATGPQSGVELSLSNATNQEANYQAAGCTGIDNAK